MANNDFTAANAQIILVQPILFPSGIRLQGFSVDAVASSDNVDVTETRRGVDGNLGAGVIKNPYPLTINLEATSPSLQDMFTLRDAMQSNDQPYFVTITVFLPATGMTRIFSNGVLRNSPQMPAIAKTIQPTQWTFDFEEVI